MAKSKSFSSVASYIWNKLTRHLSSIFVHSASRKTLEHHLFSSAFPGISSTSTDIIQCSTKISPIQFLLFSNCSLGLRPSFPEQYTIVHIPCFQHLVPHSSLLFYGCFAFFILKLVPFNPPSLYWPRKNSQNKSKIHCWPPLVFPEIEYWFFLFSGRNSSITFFRGPSPVFSLHPLTSRCVMSPHPRM